MNIKVILFAGLFLLLPLTIFAHPGNTSSDGMHYCWTNCSYWGEVYGQRHSHGGYSTPSSRFYQSTYMSNVDCPSYGFSYLGSCYELPANAKKSALSGFTCNYGYEKVGVGLSAKCLPEVDNGYYIGTTLFCNYGYSSYLGNCLRNNTGSSYGSISDLYYASDYVTSDSCPKNSDVSATDPDKCVCNLGYEVNKDKDGCKKISKKTNDKMCRADFGRYSLWSGKYDVQTKVPTCKCKKGYEWNIEGTSCTKE